MSIGFPKARAAKIAGLDVRTLEAYLGLVETALARDQEAGAGTGGSRLQKNDILAVEAEYEVFNEVVTMYRKKMAPCTPPSCLEDWECHSVCSYTWTKCIFLPSSWLPLTLVSSSPPFLTLMSPSECIQLVR